MGLSGGDDYSDSLENKLPIQTVIATAIARSNLYKRDYGVSRDCFAPLAMTIRYYFYPVGVPRLVGAWPVPNRG